MEGETTTQNQAQDTAPAGAPVAAEGTVSDNKTLMAVLSYLSILVIIPYLTSKQDRFVHFHIKQGLVLFTIEVAVLLLGMIMWMLIPILDIVNLAMVVFSIVGIVNAVQGKEKELPLLGQFAKHFDNV